MEPKTGTRVIRSDIDGNVSAMHQDDDETCLMLSNLTRVSLLKLFGGLSRADMTNRRLDDSEIDALNRFRHLLD